MKVRCVDSGGNLFLTKGKEYEFIREEQFSKSKGYVVIADDEQEHWYLKERFEIVKEKDNMKKLTFREVIANIKEGEVYIRCSSRNRKIFMENGDIAIKNTNGCMSDTIEEPQNELYELKRNKVSFTEAFKAYEEGKEIESCVSGAKINSGLGHIMKNDYSFDDCENLFSFNEITGEWYIN